MVPRPIFFFHHRRYEIINLLTRRTFFLASHFSNAILLHCIIYLGDYDFLNAFGKKCTPELWSRNLNHVNESSLSFCYIFQKYHVQYIYTIYMTMMFFVIKYSICTTRLVIHFFKCCFRLHKLVKFYVPQWDHPSSQ